MNSPPMLIIFMPLPEIFFSEICPIHCSLTLFHIIFPISFKIVSRWIVVHFSIPVFEVIFKTSFKNTATFENNFAFSFFFPLFPLSFVSCIVNSINTIAMPESILNLSFINATIWPFIDPFTSYPVISKLTLINDTIGPSKFTFAIEQSIIKISIISIAIFKSNGSRTI